MKRDLVINVLLIIAGILLAFALFGAGAVWKGKMPPRRPSASSAPEVGNDPGQALAKAGMEEAMPNTENVASTPDARSVVINGRALSEQQLQELATNYGAAPPPGRYWYDTMSGMWGYEGREALGFIRPGHAFGPVSPRASNGNTGAFVNGREINFVEALFYQRVFGGVRPGRFWLDGRTGNIGVEGNPLPLANLALAIEQAQSTGQSAGGGHRSVLSTWDRTGVAVYGSQ